MSLAAGEVDLVFEEEPHRYSVQGKPVPSVTQVISKAGLGPDFFLVPPEVLALAKQRGVAVHKACELLIQKKLKESTVDPRIQGYVSAYREFLKTLAPKLIACEKMMSADIRHQGQRYAVAGRLDLYCWIHGERWVIDIKTGPAQAGLQTAAYAMILSEWSLAATPNAPLVIKKRATLRLDRKGTYKLIPHNDLRDDWAFRDLLAYYYATQKIEEWKKLYQA
jgi:hypothetical protein